MCQLFWEECLHLLEKKDHKELIARLSKLKEQVSKIILLYEKCLGIRLTITRRLSKYMTVASRLDDKLLHLLELLNRIGHNTKFHKKQTSKAIDLLGTLNRSINNLEIKMENTFNSFTGKYEISDSYNRICDNLLGILRMDEVPWKNLKDQLSKLPTPPCCFPLGVLQGSQRCEDINNNTECRCVELVNNVLEQDWKEDLLRVEKKVNDYADHYKFLCSLYAIKDDWEEDFETENYID